MKIDKMICPVFLFFSGLAFISCAGLAHFRQPAIWGDPVRLSMQSTVYFYQMTVTSYNGIAVARSSSARFPAGKTTISARVDIVHSNVNFTFSGMEFSYYFEPGREYAVSGAARDMLWGVNIYSGRHRRLERLITFVPFNYQPVTDGRR